MTKPTIAALQDEVGRLTIDAATTASKFEAYKGEANAIIRERDALRKELEQQREARANDKADYFRLAGMLDMLREMGVIPAKEEVVNYSINNVIEPAAVRSGWEMRDHAGRHR